MEHLELTPHQDQIKTKILLEYNRLEKDDEDEDPNGEEGGNDDDSEPEGDVEGLVVDEAEDASKNGHSKGCNNNWTQMILEMSQPM